jgi:hypothetical protein
VVEMNCFLCHTPQPDNQARIETLQAGRFAWANTASLLGSGIVTQDGQDLHYNPDAFSPAGELLPEWAQIQDPTNAELRSMSRLGPYRPGREFHRFRLWGRRLACQRLRAGDLASAHFGFWDQHCWKAGPGSRPFDVHAERLVQCTDCHHAANNPTFAQKPHLPVQSISCLTRAGWSWESICSVPCTFCPQQHFRWRLHLLSQRGGHPQLAALQRTPSRRPGL